MWVVRVADILMIFLCIIRVVLVAQGLGPVIRVSFSKNMRDSMKGQGLKIKDSRISSGQSLRWTKRRDNKGKGRENNTTKSLKSKTTIVPKHRLKGLHLTKPSPVRGVLLHNKAANNSQKDNHPLLLSSKKSFSSLLHSLKTLSFRNTKGNSK